MRYALLLSLPVAVLNLAFAQEEEVERDMPTSTRRVRRGQVFHQEIAYNHLLGAPDTLRGSVEGLGSIKLNLSWIPHVRIGSFYMGAGLGIAIREVRFEEPVILLRTDDKRLSYEAYELPAGVRGKSKLQLGYLRVPLELGLIKRKLNFAVFGYGDLLLWAKHKRKYRENGNLTRLIFYGNRNVLTEVLQYGVGARIGYGGIGLFANYNLSPLWKPERGPANVHALQAGVYFFEAGLFDDKPAPAHRKTRATATSY